MSNRSYDSVPSRRVAFLGLGVMGFPMAGHLARAGHSVTVYNRSTAKAEAWQVQYGGERAATPAAAAAAADFVFACVGNDDDLRSVVLGSDQNGRNPKFIEFAAGATVLVLHLAVTNAASDALALRHARPAVVGEVAAAIGPGRLVLSHLIEAPAPVETEQYSLANLDEAVAEVRRKFQGQVDVAADLQVLPIR